MKSFDSRVLAPLARCFMRAGVVAVHEHTAIHYWTSFGQDAAAHNMLGYNIVKDGDDGPVFLQHRSHDLRLELINHNTPEHQAWAVENSKDFDALTRVFVSSTEFQPIATTIETETFRGHLFSHRETGAIIQIVWRQTQIFKDLFGPKAPGS